MPAEWGVPTPSGHTYRIPTTYKDARERVNDFAQGEIESWDDPERCPEPTWEIVSHLLDEIERRDIVVRGLLDEFNQQVVARDDRFDQGGAYALREAVRRFEDDHG